MRTGLLAAIFLTALPAAADAHHSIAAVYDRDKAISFTGKLTVVEFVNPHSRLQVEFTGKDGKPVLWTIEAAATRGMERLGLTKDTLAIGERVKVIAYPARSGQAEAWLTRLETADRSYELGFRRTEPPPVPVQLN